MFICSEPAPAAALPTGSAREGKAVRRASGPRGQPPPSGIQPLGPPKRPETRPITTASPAAQRSLVLLSLGRRPVETADTPEDAPREHWREVARLLDADIASHATACARRGGWFAAFDGARRPAGAALSAALDASRYGRIYAIDEDVGFRCALLLRARGWRGRMVCLVHHLSPKRRAIVRLLGGTPIAHFFTYTDQQRAALLDAGVPANRVTARPIPADTNFFTPAPRAAGRARVVAIGAADRDYRTLFAAAAAIDADIEIFGHGYAGPDAAGLCGDPPANVRFMPHVPVAALRNRLASAAVAAIPLVPTDHAAGATVLVEAMACGVPVVMTETMGSRFYLHAASPGATVPPGDAPVLAAAINGLLADPARARTVGERNREWVLANATVPTFARLVADAVRADD